MKSPPETACVLNDASTPNVCHAGFHVPDTLADEELCELIEYDAARIMAAGSDVRLERYLGAIPDLSNRPAVLDVAIDFVLQSRATTMSKRLAVQLLCEEHPFLNEAIHTAALLNDLFTSTHSTRNIAPRLTLPCCVGPPCSPWSGRYELLEIIGHGSQGSVFRAVDRLLSAAERPAWVAVKIVRTAPCESAMQGTEATRARQVQHTAVVRVLDQGDCPGGIFYVFELVDGTTLDVCAQVSGGKLHQFKAADLTRQLAEAVAAIHAVGVVHRDIKPSNILIAKDGLCRLTDLGIGRSAGESFDQAVLPRGAIAFIAPEQYLRTARGADPAVDIYAIGAVLYWMLTGDLPNGEDAEKIDANLTCESPVEWPRGSLSSLALLDPDIAAICRRAVAFQIEARYQTAAAMVADLERFLRKEPLPWRHASSWRRFTLARRRAPKTFWLAVLLVVIAVASPAILAWQRIAYKEDQAAVRILRAEERAEAARVTADVERGKMAQTRQLATILRSMLGRVAQSSDEDAWLPALASLDALCAPDALGMDDLHAAVEATRIQILSRRVESALQGGHSDHLDVLLLETQLGLCLLNEGKPREAAAHLEGLFERLKKRLVASDPILLGVQAAAASARIQSELAGSNEAAFQRAQMTLKCIQPDDVGRGFRTIVRKAKASLPP